MVNFNIDVIDTTILQWKLDNFYSYIYIVCIRFFVKYQICFRNNSTILMNSSVTIIEVTTSNFEILERQAKP